MSKFIFLILVPVLLGAGISSGGRNQLSIGHDKLYTFHSTPATWDEAKGICKKQGGRLAIVTSEDVEDEMLKLWKRSGPVVNATNGLTSQAFIGLRITIKGHWECIDGGSPAYLNWSPDWAGRQQPDNSKIQQCGSLLKQGGMDDVQCDYKLAFFCEKLNVGVPKEF